MLRIANARCDMAVVFGCPRGVCWASTPPPRVLCRACCIAILEHDPDRA